MAKKKSRSSATKDLATSYFTVKRRRRHALPLSSKQVPMKIEGVRKHMSKWAAEIKHPENKNVRIWLGSYVTQEEASKVYQLKKMEHEKLKLQTLAEKDKLVADQEVISAQVKPNAESLSDDPDVMMKVVNSNVFKESKEESQSDDRDGTMNVVDSDEQAERSLSRQIVEQAGDMSLQLGPILVDRYGYLLGEFSWMDDLSIV